MGTGASKAKNLNVSQEPSLEKQKGQSDGRDCQSGKQVHLTREEQPRKTNVSEQASIQSKEHDSTNLTEQSQIVWPSGSTNTETESPESSKTLHSSSTQGDPNESTQSKEQEGKKSGPAWNNEQKKRSSDEADHRQSGSNCQKEDQHSSKQRECQTHDFSMRDGVIQPGCAMQGNYQHQGHPIQGGIQVPFYPMPGGMQQPGYAMPGGMQHPGYAMQGGMQQPAYAMQGGMQQSGFATQGGMQQPGYFMQGGMQQPGYFMQGGMQQPSYLMQGGMQQPGYSMQGAFQQPGYSIPGGIQQAGYVMQGGIQQPGYPMQEAFQQPGYPMQGRIQQPGCPMQQGAVQPPGYPMQGGGQHQVYPMQRVVQQQGHPMQGAVQQSGYPIQKGIQEPGFALQSRTDHAIQGGDQQRGYTMKERGPQPPDTFQGGPRGPQALSSVQPYQVCTDRDLPGEEHQPDQERQIEEQRPNSSFSETDGQQKLSKPPQPHSKGSHKINFAVDPAVLEFVSSSRHNEDLTKLTDERQLKFRWKAGSNNAVLEYSGIKDESLEAEYIEVMQSFLQTFEKCDLPIHDEIWKEVQDDLYNIRTILGRDPPLLKCISSYNDRTEAALRIVASKNDIERHKALLENKIEEVFKKATFQSKSITNISKSHLNLLKEINFCENLHEQYPKVEVHLDPVKGEIHLKGPKGQVGIAIQKFQDQQNAATEKEVRLNSGSFEILATKDGNSAVVKALRDENIKAVVEYHLSVKSVKVLGSSEEHAKKAASIISGIITEETVPFSKNYISLLKDDGWSKYCKEIQEKKGVIIRKGTSDEICVMGLKSNAIKAARKLQFYLDNNAELVEEIECDSIDVKKYLLRRASSIQETYGVKVQNEEESLNFWVSGRDQELKKAMDTIINKFSKDIEVSTHVVNQPGLTNFLKSGDLDVRIKKIEDQENCVIRIEKNLGPRGTNSSSHAVDCSATSGFATSSESSTLFTTHGHTLSWKSGDIMKEQADLLVIPQGVCFDAIRANFDQATIQAATKLTAGNICVSTSFTLPCTQVIHCCCSYWNSDGEKILRAIVKSCILKGEELRVKSIAFPVMGTGNLGFPPLEASRIMLDETIKACEKSPHTTLKDIRFVIYYKDQALIGAFKQEVMKLQNPTNTAPNTDGTGGMNIEVIQGDITQETTEAIVNVIGPDMDMCNFGQLSKIIAETGGLQVQQECRQKGTQIPGSAVMTSGGRLAVKHIIHIVTGSSDKTHLQRCLEEGLRLADTNGIKSISVPAIGTGGYGLPAAESARIIFQALNNVGSNFTNISKVRIVVFQAQMVNVFQQQQHQKSSLSPLTAVAAPSMFSCPIKVDVVTGDLTKESSEAIVNVIGTDLNMNNFGQLSRVIAQSCGPQVQQELNQKGTQTPGSAVMTSGGTLIARHIIHIVATTSDRQELETCLEEGLRLADANGIKAISVPAIGTGGFGLSASESAQLIFQALNNMGENFENISTVRIVVFQTQMVQAFQREQQKPSLPPMPSLATHSLSGIPIKVDVVNGNLTQENSNAIVNVVGTDLNMKNFGQLSNAIAQTCGPQVQQELNQKGTQAPGSAVMTSGGTLIAQHIIHIVTATADKQQLQTCLEEGLRLADANDIKSISIPAIGTGGFGLSATESAQVIFQALSKMSGHFTSISTIRVVVFQKQMTQAFLQEQQSSLLPRTTASRGSSGNIKAVLPSSNLSVTVWVTGGKSNVKKAMDELKKLFSSACITKKVDMEGICSLSDIQVNQLKQEAYKYDVEITVNKTRKSIMLRGFSADLPDMVTKIMDEIDKGIKKEKKKQEDDNAHLVSSVVEWSYTLRGRKQFFDKTTNVELEMAQSKRESTTTVVVNGKKFFIDLKSGTGRCQGDQMKITRTVKGANKSEGIPLPDNWAPMPSHEKVTLVPLNTNSNEYQDVLRQFQATVPNVNVQKIERVQNPELYRTFMGKKQHMDKRCGGNSEQKLFHGTDGKSIDAINSQGFNRSLCGKNGTAYGCGVYFARDASYSFRYAGGAGGGGAMYLARVLVGDYCQGRPNILQPDPKDPNKITILYDSVVDNISIPTIFVVFNDAQCYPDYIIRF